MIIYIVLLVGWKKFTHQVWGTILFN